LLVLEQIKLYLFRIDVVQMILDKLDGGGEVSLVELVRNVPSDRSKLTSLLNRRVQECNRVQQRLKIKLLHPIINKIIIIK